MDERIDSVGVVSIDDTGQAKAPVSAAPVRRRAGWHRTRWTKAKKEEFLDHLAGSGNVTTAARAMALDPRAVHQLRRRDAAFALDWEAAVESGYMTIETRLVGHVLAGLSRGDPVEAVPDIAEAIHFEDALRLLATRDARHLRQVKRGLPVGGQPARAQAHETDAAILKQLRAIDARKARA